MRRYISLLAAALMACAAVNAQNLNPTVQVTNDYEGKLMEVEKHNVGMAVPDSLLKFDWNFNYSVFDNPYKGAYEFSPYRIEMKPDATVRDNRRFYLRAGAGYSLHPEVQAVFTPEIKGKFGLSVYDDFKGYVGKYHTIGAVTDPENAGIYNIVRDGEYDGNEIANRFGGTLRYDASRVVFTFDAGLDYLKTKEHYFSGNNMLGGSAVLRARSVGESALLYDVSAGWTGLGNKLDDGTAYTKNFNEHDAGFDAKFVYRFADRHSIRLEPSWHHVIFKQEVPLTTYDPAGYPVHNVNETPVLADVFDIAPSYVFSDNGFSVMAGVRFADVRRSYSYNIAEYKGRRLFPDFRLYYEAVPDKFVVSAKFVGGQKFNTYGSYLKGNHHLSDIVSSHYTSVSGDATVNTFDAGVGISGRIRSRFQYGAEAGIARYYNAPMDCIYVVYKNLTTGITTSSIITETHYLPYISMTNYDLLYAELNGAYGSDRLDGSARLRLQKSIFNTDMETGYFAVALPLFSGSAALTYNWNRRLFAGVSADWATSRTGDGLYESYDRFTDCKVPGWIDLGVNAEFRVNNRFSLWAEGRNLLNHTVMRDFLTAEKGRYFTAGICLNL